MRFQHSSSPFDLYLTRVFISGPARHWPCIDHDVLRIARLMGARSHLSTLSTAFGIAKTLVERLELPFASFQTSSVGLAVKNRRMGPIRTLKISLDVRFCEMDETLNAMWMWKPHIGINVSRDWDSLEFVLLE